MNTYHYRKHLSRSCFERYIVDEFYELSSILPRRYLVANVRIRKDGTVSGCFSGRHDGCLPYSWNEIA